MNQFLYAGGRFSVDLQISEKSGFKKKILLMCVANKVSGDCTEKFMLRR